MNLIPSWLEHFQGGVVYRRFRQPDAFQGGDPKRRRKSAIPQRTWVTLSRWLARGRIIWLYTLGDGVTVAVEAGAAVAVGLQNAPVGFQVVALHPAQQGGANVEADVLKVVDNADDFALFVEDAGVGIRAVALVVDALVPVVEGLGLRFASRWRQGRGFPSAAGRSGRERRQKPR